MMTEQSNQADDNAIRAVLARYEQALNSSDTEAVMTLHTDDGVFMPQHFPSAVGSVAVRNAYDGVFKAIKLNVTFEIVEVRQVSPKWAFARTNSAGRVRPPWRAAPCTRRPGRVRAAMRPPVCPAPGRR